MAPIARGTNDPQILMVNCKTTKYKTPEGFVKGMKNRDIFGGTHWNHRPYNSVYGQND